MTIVLRGGQVLDSAQMTLQRADVLIEGNGITAVGPALATPADAQEIDASEHIVLPGLVNAHTHAHNNLLRGLATNWTLEDLLNYSAALNGGRTPEDQYLSAALGAIEMLKTGCTAAYDLFMAMPAPTEAGIEAIIRAYVDVGMRAVLAPAVADRVFYRTVPDLLDLLPADLRRTVEAIEAAPTAGLLQLSERTIREWHGTANGRIRLAVAPTIPGQCSDEFLTDCARLAREYGVSLHTHLAESKVQAIYALRRWGKSIVAHLADLGVLGPEFVGAHAVWLTDDDVRLLADAGAAVAHNPASNLKLGSGIAPIRELLDAGVAVGLGTDGSMSSDNQNMFEAMRFAALVNTVRFPHRQERWLGGQDVWRMATAGGVRLLGLADASGAIVPGHRADIVMLRANSVFLRPLNHVPNTFVYVETGADVDTVLVDGRVVLQHGRVLGVDEDRIRSRVQEAAERLRASNRAAWTLAEQLRPYVSAACHAAVDTPYAVNRYAAAAAV